MAEGGKDAYSGKLGGSEPRRKFLGRIVQGAKIAGGVLAIRGGIQTKDETVEAAERAKGFYSGLLFGEPKRAVESLVGKEPTYFNLVYRGLSGKDLEDAKIQAMEEGRSMADSGRLLRIAEHEGLITKIAEAHGIPKELLLGLAAYESEGFAKSVGKAGEKGLTHMSDAIALKHGLRISDGDDDERFDPEKCLRATAEELAEARDQLGNLGLGVLRWNTGEPQLYDELLAPYFANTYGEEPGLEVQNVSDFFKAKIGQHEVTVYHLFKNLEGWERVRVYVPRVLGVAGAYYGCETIINS